MAARARPDSLGSSSQLLEASLGILPGHSDQPPEDAPFTANRSAEDHFIIDIK